MKILYIVTAFPRHRNDVITPWLTETIRKLEQKGHSVMIFTSSYRGLKQKEIFGIPVYRFRYFFKKWETLTHDMAVPERLKSGIFFKLLIIPYITFGCINALYISYKYNFDIIHVHWPFPHIIFGYLIKLLTKKPLIATFHGAEIILLRKKFPFLIPFFKKLLLSANFNTVNSSFTMKNLSALIPSKKIKIIPFGCSIAKQKKGKPQAEKNEILFVGRLVERKGVCYLIEAFAKIAPQHQNLKLRIVGDGPLRNSLISLTKKLGINDKVIFSGFVSNRELIKSYEKAKVFVLPAIVDSHGDTEGLGVVLIEAISYGIPVIASNVGGIPDIIKDKETGILVPEKDPVALSKAIIDLLKNSQIRKTLVNNAEKHIKTNFSWEAVISKLDNLYKYFNNHPR
ncbi:MAG: hypothetical protein B5M53_01945 [Candidatus Cloacimonas sp. 4484_209]|nr:MAG: hypothetical protein B5M53_01945 [Candidatus Cloacimonas sp. 4484_209]